MDERPAQETPQAKPASTGDKPTKKSSLVRSLILLVACAGALGWAYKLVQDGMRPTLGWAKMLRGGDSEDRQVAARELGNSETKDYDVAVPALVAALKDDDEKVRAVVASGLGVIGRTSIVATPPLAEAKEVARALTDALADPSPEVRISAADSFGVLALTEDAKFPADPAMVASAVVGLLTDPSSLVRKTGERAIVRLTALGPIEPPAALLEGLKAWPSKESRAEAAVVLGSFQANPGPTVAALIAALKDKEPEVRGDSAVGLEKLGIEAAPALPSLMAALDDSFVPPPPTPRSPGVASGSPDADPTRPDDSVPPDPAVQAARAIGPIVKAQGEKGVAPPVEVVSALTKALHSDRSALKDAAGEALQKIGKGASAAIPGLIRDLAGSPDPSGPGHAPIAATVLGGLAPGTDQAGPAIEALTSALDAKEPATRKAAVAALGKFGPSAAATLPRLKALAEGADDDLTRTLRLATARIEGRAPVAPRPRQGGGVMRGMPGAGHL